MPRIPAIRSPELTQATRAFEQWRGLRTSRRIPELMWKRAADLACRYGVHRTARALRLNYATLKNRTAVSVRIEDPVSVPASPFMEIFPVNGGGAECVVELERSDGGKMRIQFKGASAPDLMGLSRAFWGTPT